MRSQPALGAAADPQMTERPCPLCGTSDAETHLVAPDTTFGYPGHFRVARCTRCGMLYTNPQVDPGSIGRFFPPDYSAHAADRAHRHAKSKRKGRDPWDGLAPFGTGNLLDVGCGSGAFLLRQRNAGWRVFGIEPSEAAADAARALGLNDIWTADVSSAPFNGHKFDVITLMGVLDHIPDPLTALVRLFETCNVGGRLIATVPNAAGAAATKLGPNWPGWDLPRHQNHFTPDTLRQMLEKAGFTDIELRYKRRTSHWRQGARNRAAATNSMLWKLVAASRNLAGLLARFHARGPHSDEIIAVAHRR